MPKQPIPFIDLRGKTAIDLLRAYPDKANALIRSARSTYGFASRLASFVFMPLADRYSHKWLSRTQNPYMHEIESMASILDSHGVYTFNICFEWGCTSGAWRSGNAISMLRVLDWPFPSLGEHVVVALQDGEAGEFYNITWPGLSGMFTGMAPSRFSAALNQAPMRKHKRGYVGDWLVNRKLAYKQDGIPPAHLLRQVFETADSYELAKLMLIKTPIAIPAIFILAGTKPGEGCVIERLENEAEILELSADQYVRATNHFVSRFDAIGDGWRPREIDSKGRYRHSGSIGGYELDQQHFSWLRAPIINADTRLCVVADAQAHRLMVQGFDASLVVTELFHKLPIDDEHQETTE